MKPVYFTSRPTTVTVFECHLCGEVVSDPDRHTIDVHQGDAVFVDIGKFRLPW